MALTGDITGSLLASMSASGGVNGEIAFDGSGTDNYNELDNKPSINGVVLEGNKTSADLHISSEGTDNYNDLLNKPKINGTTLTGDVSDTQLLIDYNHLINKPDIPDITEIETRLDNAETDIDNLQSDMSTAEDNIDDILDDIASIKATDLTQNADISSLKNRVTSAETNISNLSTRVTNSESTITTHTTEISSIEGDITSLEGIVGDGQQTVGSDLTDAVTQLNSSLTQFVTKNITWNSNPAGYTNGNYYIQFYDTGISATDYNIESVWLQNSKYKMPCYVCLENDTQANYNLRLSYLRSDISATDLAGAITTIIIAYKRK